MSFWAIVILVLIAEFLVFSNATRAIVTMKTKANSVCIAVFISGKVIVDWGDGKQDILNGLKETQQIEHLYDTDDEKTIILKGRARMLIALDVCDAQLTSLDVSKNINLLELDIAGNQLTSLDVSKNIMLLLLSGSNNSFTSLDVSNNTMLKWLWVSNNQITSLDVSNNKELLKLDVSNNPLLSNPTAWLTFLKSLPDRSNKDKGLLYDVSFNDAETEAITQRKNWHNEDSN